jgi:ABC-type nitrate/sulfonate/bicarbonate transport system substrate-binding protein
VKKLGFMLIVAATLSRPMIAWPADKVHVSHSAISGSQAILWVTHDNGFFKKAGLEPQLVFVSGGPPNIAALVSGDLDFTVFAGPASIAANLEGADTIVLMSFINTMEHTFITRPDIKKPADLKGKNSGSHVREPPMIMAPESHSRNGG